MEIDRTELKQVAAQLLAGMLANPHIYPMYSDEMARGQKEQDLLVLAIELAEKLIQRSDQS